MLLLYCVFSGIPLAYALLVCWGLFMGLGLREYRLGELLRFSWTGAKTSFGVIKTLLLIGATIGIWMASGTISSIVYYAFLLINPHLFVVVTFLVCAAVSFVIGTSFGTVSVVGLPLMLIAKSGHTNLDLVAGAIIAGIYFGDRCSPLSSSASLVATISLTNLFDNIKNMLLTSWLALLVSTLAYGALSLMFPLSHLSHTLLGQLNAQFIVAWPLLLPAAVILILSLFKRPLVESITVSILLAIVLGLHYQQTSWLKLGRALVLGVQAGHGQLIGGGGLISMVTPLTIVFLSCCISGILNHLSQLKLLEHRLTQIELTPRRRFGLTAAMALMTSAIGCNQSVAIIMTNTLIKNNYQHQNNALAVELENTSVLLAPIVPWNIAVFVPISILGTSFIGYLPYAFFLYLVPILYAIFYVPHQQKGRCHLATNSNARS